MLININLYFNIKDKYIIVVIIIIYRRIYLINIFLIALI